MIVLYTSPGCASCRKVRQWLKDHNLEFIEKNIFNTLLNKKEIKYLLLRTDNGTDDIISKRSKIIMSGNIDLESMSINELVDFVIENPSILRRPIIVSERDFQIGYDHEEIDALIPREIRNIKCQCDGKCPNYPMCANVRNPVADKKVVVKAVEKQKDRVGITLG